MFDLEVSFEGVLVYIVDVFESLKYINVVFVIDFDVDNFILLLSV